VTAVSVVTVKAPYGVAGRGRVVHVPQPDARAVFKADRVIYLVTWLCENGSGDAIFLAEPDARPMCAKCNDLSQPPVVYRCHSKDGTTIYIGATTMWTARRHQHERRSHWWPQVADVQFERYNSVAEAWAAEAIAIESERPLYNRTWSRAAVAA
jgi:predicted GIY-YIG superfamily endonuclease